MRNEAKPAAAARSPFGELLRKLSLAAGLSQEGRSNRIARRYGRIKRGGLRDRALIAVMRRRPTLGGCSLLVHISGVWRVSPEIEN
jgi:hypothetical protein